MHRRGNMKIGVVSLFANPIHSGHIQYIQESAKMVDHLFAIVNNDEQVKLKGSQEFMDENERLEVVKNIKGVWSAKISQSKEINVASDLEALGRHIEQGTHLLNIPAGDKSEDVRIYFFNSGDRVTSDPKEKEVCEKFHILPVFLALPKINSSSEILSKIVSG
jgi:cytidyltransferase-like protein